MYEMMMGELPFEAPSMSSFSNKVLHNPVQYPRWLSSNAMSILKGVSIDNIKAKALGVPYSLLNIVFSILTDNHYIVIK
jgi:hypothetical protein